MDDAKISHNLARDVLLHVNHLHNRLDFCHKIEKSNLVTSIKHLVVSQTMMRLLLSLILKFKSTFLGVRFEPRRVHMLEKNSSCGKTNLNSNGVFKASVDKIKVLKVCLKPLYTTSVSFFLYFYHFNSLNPLFHQISLIIKGKKWICVKQIFRSILIAKALNFWPGAQGRWFLWRC